MPAFDRKLDDAEIAALANYLRASWGNRAPPVTASDVARQRVGD
jgi:mono/diheme cytochrome c family protein